MVGVFGYGRLGASFVGELVDGKLENIVQASHAEWVRQIAISPDGKLVALQEDFSSGLIYVYQIDRYKEPLLKVRSHSARTIGVAFTPDGTQLITGGDDLNIRFWDMRRSGELAGTLYAGERVRYIGFLPNHDMIAASPDGWLCVWKYQPVVEDDRQ